METSATINEINAAKTNTGQGNEILNANCSSHACMIHAARGHAIRLAAITGRRKSLFIIKTISFSLAPITFRMPISFVRCSAVKAANPNKPRQAIKITSAVKRADTIPSFFSVRCFASKFLSRKVYSNGASGAYFFQKDRTRASFSSVSPFVRRMAISQFGSGPITTASACTGSLKDCKLKSLIIPITSRCLPS